MTVIVEAPKNVIPRIQEVWVALSVDEGGEGVCATMVGNTLMPLIAADEVRLEWITQQAELVARMSGRNVRLVKLTQRVDVKEFSGAH